MPDPILENLNPEQREAVLHVEGPLLILAGAGSGKTRVITHRIAHLIENAGADPSTIYAVTFTNKAAEEMRSRVERLIGREARSLWISTFHSSCVRILRRDYPQIGGDRNFTIYDETDQALLIKEILLEQNYDIKRFKPKAFVDVISRAKDELLDPEAWKARNSTAFNPFKEKVPFVFEQYQRRLRKQNALDFGDLIAEVVRLFTESPETLERYRDQFRFIMVDEYQDTNHAQYRLVKLLAERERNIAVVGDDDQSIYAWRGADITNILNFEKDYNDAKVVKLTRNYRSTQPILDAASNVISHNSGRKEKRLWTDEKTGDPVEIVIETNEFEEAGIICAQIERLRSLYRYRYNDFACFYRAHAQSRVLEEVFRRNGIPYKIVGGVSFYNRTEIKDILAYLRLSVNPADDISAKRAVVRPGRGIGNTTIERLTRWAQENDRSFMEACSQAERIEGIGPGIAKKAREFFDLIGEITEAARNLGVSQTLELTLQKSGYRDALNEDDPEDERRLENLLELLSATQDYEEQGLEPTVSAFLESITLKSELDGTDFNQDSVTFMTLHGAKGLEFQCVFMTAMEESIFPSGRAIGGVGSAEELEEERRLAYVGYTRARRHLFLTLASERRLYGQVNYNLPSRFIREAGLALPAQKTPAFQSSLKNFKAAPYGKHSLKSPRKTPVAHRTQWEDDGFSQLPPEERSNGLLGMGARVKHHRFGVGTITAVKGSGEDATVTVRFPVGTKKLMVKYANLQPL